MKSKSILAVAMLMICSGFSNAQDDPASQTDVIKQTLNTIKEVEKLNEYIQSNATLAAENKSLKDQVASLSKQIQQLTVQIQTSNETLRKQLLSLPEVEVKSKMVSRNGAVAVLKLGERLVRIRDKVEMSVPVENGIWTLMRVEKISKDVIELKFIELDRTVTIYN